MPIRRCPDCGEEFQPHVVTCSECGTLLEDGIEGESAAADAAPEDAAAYVSIGGSFDVETARAAAEHLAGAQLRFRLAPAAAPRRNSHGELALWVNAEDAPAAHDLLVREGILAPTDDAPPVGAEGGPCPACQTHVAPGTLECPECGLVLGGDLEV